MNNKLSTRMNSLIMAFAFFLSTGTIYAADYHVAKSGNDNNSGSSTSPFRTIGKAASVANPGDVVWIHEGTYEETLRPARSGTAGNPITFQSQPGEKVIITAMQALSGWTNDAGAIYKKTVNWDLGQKNFVMNNSTAMDLARWPNNTDGDPFTLNSKRNSGGSGGNVSVNAYLTHNQIPNINWTGGSILFYGDKAGSGWTTWKAFIKSSSSGRVNFDLIKNQSWIRTFHAPADKGDYFLEGVKGALDYQNEWYFDSNTKTIYVQLPGGAAPQNGKILMRRRDMTVNLRNRNYIQIKNLAVFGGGIEIRGKGNKLYGVSSFYGNYTRGVSADMSSGNRSILVDYNSENTVIERCEIAFGSGTGISDSGKYTIIENNHIHDFNFLGAYDGPIRARGGNNTTIKKNTLYRGGRDVLQIINKNSEVAYNDFSKSNLIADDCALLYTIGPNLNMEIHHNWFHDTEGRGNLTKSAGIYLDNDAGNVKVHHNVVYNTEWANLQINWNGTNIEVFNNTFWDGSKAMGAWHKAGTQFSNVKVWNNLTNKNSLEPQSNKQNNLIMGVNSNPFVDEANLNFALKPGQQAINYGRVINGITNGYVGSKPDAGAYEFGGNNWTAGIDWDKSQGPAGHCYGLPGENCTPSGGGGPTTQTPYAQHNLPGKVEAEDFDNGGQNVAFNDDNTVNQGGKYRTTAVDIETTGDSQGGAFNVGWTATGEWLEYTVTVDETAEYNLKFRVASNIASSKFKLLVDGSPVTGDVSVPNTGGWQSYQDIAVNNKTLQQGSHVFRLEVVSSGFNINHWSAAKVNNTGTTQTPYKTLVIPGRVEVEDYDNGGQNVAFNDLSAGNQGNGYRNDAVDITSTTDDNGAYIIGWTETGEWLEYTVDVQSTKAYDLFFRVASTYNTGKIRLLMDGVPLTSTLAVPNTGGWQTFKTLHIRNKTLQQGSHVFRLEIVSGAVNVNYWAVWPTPNATNPPATNFTVRARGTNGNEQIRLKINGTTIETWSLTTTMQDYTASTTVPGNIRIEYFNNGVGGDAFIDYVKHDNTTLQAEAQNTNTAVWQNGSCGSGSLSSWMHCNGYIDFGSYTRFNSSLGFETAKLYPNPTSGMVMISGIPQGTTNVKVLNSLGQLVKEDNVTDLSSVNMSNFKSGIYLIVISQEKTRRTFRVVKN